jgi:hypothetical protein
MGKGYYYLAGIISLATYTLLVFMIYYFTISNKKPITKYANSSKTTFEVSIAQSSPKIIPSENKISLKTKPKTIKQVSKHGGDSLKQQMSLDSLFDDVNDKIISKNLSTNSPKIVQKISSTKKGSQKQLQKKASQILEQFSKKTKSIQIISTQGEQNEYYNKVHHIVSTQWIPHRGDFGLRITVVLDIDRFGRLQKFKITKPSKNKDFNTRFLSILQNLKNTNFPINTKDSSIEFVFIAM